MLVLARHSGESIMIGDDIQVMVVDVRGEKVRVGIDAPRSVSVHRKEVYDLVKAENKDAAGMQPGDIKGISANLPPPLKLAKPTAVAPQASQGESHLSFSPLAVIGAGNMAEAIVRGLLNAGRARPDAIVAADISPARRELFAGMGVRTVADAAEAAKGAKVVLLAVKPQHLAEVLKIVGPAAGEHALFLSIAAGKSAAYIEEHLRTASGESAPPSRFRVVRSMPNTPMLVGEGMVAICPGARATGEDMKLAAEIFAASAEVMEVKEELMDAVTAISGSGPAYFYYLVEQLIAAGVEMGLSQQQADQLARKTALGAAKLLTGSSDSPAELRRKVTSPGGTTQAAIETMEAKGVGAGLRAAFHRARERAEEMNRG